MRRAWNSNLVEHFVLVRMQMQEKKNNNKRHTHAELIVHLLLSIIKKTGIESLFLWKYTNEIWEADKIYRYILIVQRKKPQWIISVKALKIEVDL